MIKKISIYVVIILVLLGVGRLWYQRQVVHPALQQAPHLRSSITVAKVRFVIRPNQVSALGVLKAQDAVKISTEVPGKVVAVLFKPGSYVTKGTLLYKLDDSVIAAQLRQAQAQLLLSQSNYQRYQSLKGIDKEAISEQLLDRMHAKYKEDTALVNYYQAQVAQTVIRAPFSGYVAAKHVSVGDYVVAGAHLTSLVDRNYLLAIYHLPEQYLPQLQLGQRVKVHLENVKAKPIFGKVSYIAPKVNVATHSVAVHALILNKKNTITPGLFIKVIQSVGKSKKVMVIPQAALVPTIEGSQVYRVRNGKAYAVPVTTGFMFKDDIEIVKGLRPGDVVVTSGQTRLRSGSPVKEANAP